MKQNKYILERPWLCWHSWYRRYNLHLKCVARIRSSSILWKLLTKLFCIKNKNEQIKKNLALFCPGHFMFQFKGCMLEETSYWVCRRPMSIHWCRQYKATRVGGLVQKETNLEWSISTMLAMSQTFLLYPKGGGNCKANIFLAKCTSVAALFPLEDDDAHCCL